MSEPRNARPLQRPSSQHQWHLWEVIGSQVVQRTAGRWVVAEQLLLNALLSEDVYLGGTLMMMYAVLLVIGNLLADIALAWVDPRIRYE